MARFKLDLGIPSLARDWADMFRVRHLAADVGAAFTVACIAIPLSLAIALASGVAPAVGIVTAIVGGIVCALFGGTRLQVSGPAAAMAVLIATVVQEHGLAALLVVGLGTGILQMATGVLRLGRFVRLVPLPVIEGFTAGIGAIILIGQLPRALGLPPPTQSHVFDVVTHITELFHKSNVAAVGITLLSLAIIYGFPRLTKRIPAQLIAVVVTTILVYALNLSVATIGDIPRTLPWPKLPAMPESLAALVAPTLAVFALASLETLLSATAVEKLVPSERNDPDQELIGQGVGNIASAMFGGIPVTGVIARSATNVQAGGKTRRAPLLHAVVLILGVFALAPAMSRIPIPALAGVLFSVAFRMLSPVSLLKLWRHSRSDGVVYVLTFGVIVFVDLLEGVQWGVVAALVIAAVKLGRARMLVKGARTGEHYLFALEGSLTFLSSLDVENLRSELDVLEKGRGVLFDVRGVRTLDASGAELLAGLVEHARMLGLRPVVIGLADEHRARFLAAADDPAHIESTLAATEREAVAGLTGSATMNADARLQAGIERYRGSMRPQYAQLFESLANEQKPHTLFITCADSRLSPNLITGTDPGELFIIRNIGNIVPTVGTLAAIEYAIGILDIGKIVVCGHSSCGAIKALLSDEVLPDQYPNLKAWLDSSNAREQLRSFPQSIGRDEIARMNALAQLDHLRALPLVAERERAGKLSLAAWFFDVKSGEIEEWSRSAQRFVPVGASSPTPSEVQAAGARRKTAETLPS